MRQLTRGFFDYIHERHRVMFHGIAFFVEIDMAYKGAGVGAVAPCRLVWEETLNVPRPELGWPAGEKGDLREKTAKSSLKPSLDERVEGIHGLGASVKYFAEVMGSTAFPLHFYEVNKNEIACPSSFALVVYDRPGMPEEYCKVRNSAGQLFPGYKLRIDITAESAAGCECAKSDNNTVIEVDIPCEVGRVDKSGARIRVQQ